MGRKKVPKEIQDERRRERVRKRYHSDPVFRQKLLDTAQRWRDNHPGYWPAYMKWWRYQNKATPQNRFVEKLMRVLNINRKTAKRMAAEIEAKSKSKTPELVE